MPSYTKTQFERDLDDGAVTLPEGEAKRIFDSAKDAGNKSPGGTLRTQHRPLFDRAYKAHLRNHVINK